MQSRVFEMCNISEGIEERGIKRGIRIGMQIGIRQGISQGIRQVKCENIKSVMKSLDVSIERAMDILDISEDERDEYIKLLTEPKNVALTE
jgi:predicted transposase YdaD